MEANTTTRFDRSGFIAQVTLDNKYQFCTKEPNNLSHPCSGGVGLCSEFQLFKPAEESVVGSQFPKLGIGLLTKEDDMYLFYHKYKCDPFDIIINSTDTSVTYETLSSICMGYAAHHTKTIEVINNELIMTIMVENTGELPLVFDEYCHNFVTLEQLPINEDYYLSMPIVSQDGKVSTVGGSLVGRGNGFTYTNYSNSASIIDVDKDEIVSNIPFWWKLTNKRSLAWISEEVSVKPQKVRVWSIDHIISPEVICSFVIEPGEKTSWTRKWIFDCK